MQYAILEGQRRKAAPALFATCPLCERPVLAKCGTQRIWHWAHQGKVTCDFEREKETEWHRKWKGHFPEKHQEVISQGPTGERHIADVKNGHGLVIEFQHSRLPQEERKARETFHENMVWVVDGTRLSRDLPRFLKGKKNWNRTNQKGVYTTHWPEECFPTEWLACGAPVFFDFEGLASTGAKSSSLLGLWALLPGRAAGRAVIVRVSRQTFINAGRHQPYIIATEKIVQQTAEYLALQRSLFFTA